jgi:catechol 2,3-dioxygenase-like lactoylglutathione lyase family enzyme
MNETVAHLIFYVRDQSASCAFYRQVLGRDPSLDVPGMTEFRLNAGCILGLMPERGIKRLLGEAIGDPAAARVAPRAELYLRVERAEASYERALAAGATALSGPLERDWGDVAAYCADPDGHVVAFAHAASGGSRPG